MINDTLRNETDAEFGKGAKERTWAVSIDSNSTKPYLSMRDVGELRSEKSEEDGTYDLGFFSSSNMVRTSLSLPNPPKASRYC